MCTFKSVIRNIKKGKKNDKKNYFGQKENAKN